MVHAAAVSTVPAPALARFRDSFHGRLVGPEDDQYDEARAIWNGAIDRRPGLIARCSDDGDVALAVRLAAEHDLLLSVRGGGHGVAGLAVCDDGIVVDLSAMKAIEVDPVERTVRVGAGVTLGELDAASQRFGLAVPAGIVTHTGVSGLTLGGGIGWLMRRHGLTVDNLLEADVVLADGDRVTAGPQSHPDLFWALRGGGGNFGVVTSFRFRAHPVGPEVLSGPLLFPLERAEEVMGFYREWAAAAPAELTTILNFRRAPSAPWVPDHLHGVPVLLVISCWCGEPAAGSRVIEPLRALAPLHDACEVRPFTELQTFFDASVTPGWHYYWKSVELPEMSPAAIGAIADHTERISPLSYSIAFHLGGAVARVPEADTAFPRRAEGFDVNINGVSLTGEDGQTELVRSLFRELEPHARGVYVNFLGDEGEDRVRAAYGDAYARLARIKARYDASNLFHRNQNIRPAAVGDTSRSATRTGG